MYLQSSDASQACMGTTKWTLSPNTARIVQVSGWAARNGGRISHRAERRSSPQTLLWTRRGRFWAFGVCRQCSAGSWWRTVSLLRGGVSVAHQSLPLPFTVRWESPWKTYQGKNKHQKKSVCCLFVFYGKIEIAQKRESPEGASNVLLRTIGGWSRCVKLRWIVMMK